MTPPSPSPSLTLALEFGLGGSLALGRSDGRGGIEILDTKRIAERRHGECAVPEVLAMLKELNVGPSAIGRWVCNRGPGSYSGLRVAFATIKGFLHGRQGVEWVAVDPIAALVAAAPTDDGHVAYPLASQWAYVPFQNRKAASAWTYVAKDDARVNDAVRPETVGFDAAFLLRASLKASEAERLRKPEEWLVATPDYGAATTFKKAF